MSKKDRSVYEIETTIDVQTTIDAEETGRDNSIRVQILTQALETSLEYYEKGKEGKRLASSKVFRKEEDRSSKRSSKATTESTTASDIHASDNIISPPLSPVLVTLEKMDRDDQEEQEERGDRAMIAMLAARVNSEDTQLAKTVGLNDKWTQNPIALNTHTGRNTTHGTDPSHPEERHSPKEGANLVDRSAMPNLEVSNSQHSENRCPSYQSNEQSSSCPALKTHSSITDILSPGVSSRLDDYGHIYKHPGQYGSAKNRQAGNAVQSTSYSAAANAAANSLMTATGTATVSSFRGSSFTTSGNSFATTSFQDKSIRSTVKTSADASSSSSPSPDPVVSPRRSPEIQITDSFWEAPFANLESSKAAASRPGDGLLKAASPVFSGGNTTRMTVVSLSFGVPIVDHLSNHLGDRESGSINRESGNQDSSTPTSPTPDSLRILRISGGTDDGDSLDRLDRADSLNSNKSRQEANRAWIESNEAFASLEKQISEDQHSVDGHSTMSASLGAFSSYTSSDRRNHMANAMHNAIHGSLPSDNQRRLHHVSSGSQSGKNRTFQLGSQTASGNSRTCNTSGGGNNQGGSRLNKSIGSRLNQSGNHFQIWDGRGNVGKIGSGDSSYAQKFLKKAFAFYKQLLHEINWIQSFELHKLSAKPLPRMNQPDVFRLNPSPNVITSTGIPLNGMVQPPVSLSGIKKTSSKSNMPGLLKNPICPYYRSSNMSVSNMSLSSNSVNNTLTGSAMTGMSYDSNMTFSAINASRASNIDASMGSNVDSNASQTQSGMQNISGNVLSTHSAPGIYGRQKGGQQQPDDSLSGTPVAGSSGLSAAAQNSLGNAGVANSLDTEKSNVIGNDSQSASQNNQDFLQIPNHYSENNLRAQSAPCVAPLSQIFSSQAQSGISSGMIPGIATGECNVDSSRGDFNATNPSGDNFVVGGSFDPANQLGNLNQEESVESQMIQLQTERNTRLNEGPLSQQKMQAKYDKEAGVLTRSKKRGVGLFSYVSNSSQDIASQTGSQIGDSDATYGSSTSAGYNCSSSTTNASGVSSGLFSSHGHDVSTSQQGECQESLSGVYRAGTAAPDWPDRAPVSSLKQNSENMSGNVLHGTSENGLQPPHAALRAMNTSEGGCTAVRPRAGMGSKKTHLKKILNRVIEIYPEVNAATCILLRTGTDTYSHNANDPEGETSAYMAPDSGFSLLIVGEPRAIVFREGRKRQTLVLQPGSLLWIGAKTRKDWSFSIPRTHNKTTSPTIVVKCFQHVDSNDSVGSVQTNLSMAQTPMMQSIPQNLTTPANNSSNSSNANIPNINVNDPTNVNVDTGDSILKDATIPGSIPAQVTNANADISILSTSAPAGMADLNTLLAAESNKPNGMGAMGRAHPPAITTSDYHDGHGYPVSYRNGHDLSSTTVSGVGSVSPSGVSNNVTPYNITPSHAISPLNTPGTGSGMHSCSNAGVQSRSPSGGPAVSMTAMEMASSSVAGVMQFQGLAVSPAHDTTPAWGMTPTSNSPFGTSVGTLFGAVPSVGGQDVLMLPATTKSEASNGDDASFGKSESLLTCFKPGESDGSEGTMSPTARSGGTLSPAVKTDARSNGLSPTLSPTKSLASTIPPGEQRDSIPADNVPSEVAGSVAAGYETELLAQILRASHFNVDASQYNTSPMLTGVASPILDGVVSTTPTASEVTPFLQAAMSPVIQPSMMSPLMQASTISPEISIGRASLLGILTQDSTPEMLTILDPAPPSSMLGSKSAPSSKGSASAGLVSPSIVVHAPLLDHKGIAPSISRQQTPASPRPTSDLSPLPEDETLTPLVLPSPTVSINTIEDISNLPSLPPNIRNAAASSAVFKDGNLVFGNGNVNEEYTHESANQVQRMDIENQELTPVVENQQPLSPMTGPVFDHFLIPHRHSNPQVLGVDIQNNQDKEELSQLTFGSIGGSANPFTATQSRSNPVFRQEDLFGNNLFGGLGANPFGGHPLEPATGLDGLAPLAEVDISFGGKRIHNRKDIFEVVKQELEKSNVKPSKDRTGSKLSKDRTGSKLSKDRTGTKDRSLISKDKTLSASKVASKERHHTKHDQKTVFKEKSGEKHTGPKTITRSTMAKSLKEILKGKTKDQKGQKDQPIVTDTQEMTIQQAINDTRVRDIESKAVKNHELLQSELASKTNEEKMVQHTLLAQSSVLQTKDSALAQGALPGATGAVHSDSSLLRAASPTGRCQKEESSLIVKLNASADANATDDMEKALVERTESHNKMVVKRKSSVEFSEFLVEESRAIDVSHSENTSGDSSQLVGSSQVNGLSGHTSQSNTNGDACQSVGGSQAIDPSRTMVGDDSQIGDIWVKKEESQELIHTASEQVGMNTASSMSSSLFSQTMSFLEDETRRRDQLEHETLKSMDGSKSSRDPRNTGDPHLGVPLQSSTSFTWESRVDRLSTTSKNFSERLDGTWKLEKVPRTSSRKKKGSRSSDIIGSLESTNSNIIEHQSSSTSVKSYYVKSNYSAENLLESSVDLIKGDPYNHGTPEIARRATSSPEKKKNARKSDLHVVEEGNTHKEKYVDSNIDNQTRIIMKTTDKREEKRSRRKRKKGKQADEGSRERSGGRSQSGIGTATDSDCDPERTLEEVSHQIELEIFNGAQQAQTVLQQLRDQEPEHTFVKFCEAVERYEFEESSSESEDEKGPSDAHGHRHPSSGSDPGGRVWASDLIPKTYSHTGTSIQSFFDFTRSLMQEEVDRTEKIDTQRGVVGHDFDENDDGFSVLKTAISCPTGFRYKSQGSGPFRYDGTNDDASPNGQVESHHTENGMTGGNHVTAGGIQQAGPPTAFSEGPEQGDTGQKAASGFFSDLPPLSFSMIGATGFKSLARTAGSNNSGENSGTASNSGNAASNVASSNRASSSSIKGSSSQVASENRCQVGSYAGGVADSSQFSSLASNQPLGGHTQSNVSGNAKTESASSHQTAHSSFPEGSAQSTNPQSNTQSYSTKDASSNYFSTKRNSSSSSLLQSPQAFTNASSSTKTQSEKHFRRSQSSPGAVKIKKPPMIDHASSGIGLGTTDAKEMFTPMATPSGYETATPGVTPKGSALGDNRGKMCMTEASEFAFNLQVSSVMHASAEIHNTIHSSLNATSFCSGSSMHASFGSSTLHTNSGLHTTSGLHTVSGASSLHVASGAPSAPSNNFSGISLLSNTLISEQLHSDHEDSFSEHGGEFVGGFNNHSSGLKFPQMDWPSQPTTPQGAFLTPFLTPTNGGGHDHPFLSPAAMENPLFRGRGGLLDETEVNSGSEMHSPPTAPSRAPTENPSALATGLLSCKSKDSSSEEEVMLGRTKSQHPLFAPPK